MEMFHLRGKELEHARVTFTSLQKIRTKFYDVA